MAVNNMDKKRILVLLAAHKGGDYLNDQVASILAQRNVDVSILISVDHVPGDSTEHLVDTLCEEHVNVHALPHGHSFGGAAANFYRLLADANFGAFSHIALADQDDIWNVDKLRRATDTMSATNSTCYSSNVESWIAETNHRVLVNKAQAQRPWDHLFSSAGPGCTYVFEKEVLSAFSEWLRNNRALAADTDYHDWLLYAWARQRGYRWHIDPSPTMLYRQHGANQLGANRGFAAVRRRAQAMRSGWYRQQVLAIALCVDALDEPPIQALTASSLAGRLKLARYGRDLRRSSREALLAGITLIMLQGGA